MDFSSTPIDTLIAYQFALSTAVRLIDDTPNVDLIATRDALIEISDKVSQALKDEQFEIDRMKEL